MTEKEKMLAGELYIANGTELTAERQNARRLTRLYNTTEEEQDYRLELIRELFGSTGEGVYIRPVPKPVHGVCCGEFSPELR